MHVLFDIDDTLFPSTEFSALARRNAIGAMIGMGLEADREELGAQLSRIISEKGSNYGHHFDDLLRERGVKNPSRFIAAAVAAYHDTKTSIQPYPTVPLALLRLRESGHRLYVATRGKPIKQWDKLIRLRIALFFDRVFVSESGKGPDFYREIVSELGCSSRECVMVGDREEADIAPAKEAGMRTIRVISGKYSSSPTAADLSIGGIFALLPALQDL